MSAPEPVRLLLMADYLADPLWYRAPEGMGGTMISLDRLSLSRPLKERLADSAPLPTSDVSSAGCLGDAALRA